MNHLLLIPTYNEAENVEEIIEEVFRLYKDISILIIDDSSPDGTAKKVQNLQERFKNLYIIVQPEKKGLANAYINGFKWGIENGFDLFTSCDADFSHNPIYISEFRKKIQEGYDVVVGSRYIKGGSTTEKNFFRNFISIGGNIWADMVLKTGIKDLLEGFNTYTKDALMKINLDKVKSGGFIFQTEMKYRAYKSGLKIVEVPILFKVRTIGQSKMTLGIILEALINVLLIKVNLK